MRNTPPARPVGAGLQLTPNSALADDAKWFGDQRMVAPIARAAVAANARFVGLRVIPLRPDGTEPIVRPGDLLEPSLKHDARGEPVGGLHRGTSAFGFSCRQTLARAIQEVAFFDGRQVALLTGTGAHRTEEDESERILISARALMVWYRKFSGCGRGIYPGLEHADW